MDDSVKKAHKEFELYEAQLQCPISQQDCTTDMPGGWDLDKYKFLNMIERTWEKRPNMEWYVFAEADTYVVWSNLVHWLRERAPRGDVYVGSVAMINNNPFAHGGSGYVISGSLVEKIVTNITDVAAKYDERAGHECCGDLLISLAVEEVGGKVKQAHPMFNGEKPNTLPYGPGHWCEPLLTMHHVNAEEVSSIWQYQQTRTSQVRQNIPPLSLSLFKHTKASQDIMQIKDIYHAFMSPHLVSLRPEWDNGSDDVCYIASDGESQDKADDKARDRQKPEHEKSFAEKKAHVSPAACAKVCEAAGLDISEEEYTGLTSDVERGQLIHRKYDGKVNSEKGDDFKRNRSCFQWNYHKGACCTSRSFKLGTPKRQSKDDDKWTSGWFVKGINDWINARGECDVEWKNPY